MAKLDNGPARGTRDLLPSEVVHREAVIGTIASCYRGFGFQRIETPALEGIARLTGGQGGENEKLIFKVLKRGLADPLPAETELSELTDLGLRFDLTVPLTRLFAHNQAKLPSPFRALQIGPVWRAERPARGRYRQFTQCDVDTIGEPSVLAECELLEATAAVFRTLRVAPVTIRLNDRRLLSAMAEKAGVERERQAGYFIALDHLDRLGWEGVAADLASRGYPESVTEETRAVLERLAEAASPKALIDRAADSLPSLDEGVLDGLRTTASALASLETPFVLDPAIARGMGYYTGQIFEVTHPSSSGSVAGGGRYDDLVGRSLGRAVPACGISIGFERVVDLVAAPPPDLGVAVLYGGEELPGVLAAARRVRSAGRAAALVSRRKALRQQLDALAAEGYSAFVLYEEGAEPAVRELRGQA